MIDVNMRKCQYVNIYTHVYCICVEVQPYCLTTLYIQKNWFLKNIFPTRDFSFLSLNLCLNENEKSSVSLKLIQTHQPTNKQKTSFNKIINYYYAIYKHIKLFNLFFLFQINVIHVTCFVSRLETTTIIRKSFCVVRGMRNEVDSRNLMNYRLV